MTATAVIVVDVQHAFFSGTTAAFRGDAVIAGINRLTGAAREAGAPVIFVQHESDADGPLARGSDAWQLAAALVKRDGDVSIHKTVGDAFHGTPLTQELAQRDIRSVAICGFASEFCVNTTARHAERLGFRTTVIADLHTTQDKPHLAAEKIVEHQNFVWTHSSMTGNRVAVRPLDDFLKEAFA